MILAILTAAVLLGDISLRRRRRHTLSVTAVADLSALLSLAVDSGLSLHGALRWSVAYADPLLRPELQSALRHAANNGLAAALRRSEGLAGALLRALARPAETGAAIGPVLVGIRERLEAEYLGEVHTRLQRLPVKLVIPLALLMLPGLLLMIVAPALFDVLGRFG